MVKKSIYAIRRAFSIVAISAMLLLSSPVPSHAFVVSAPAVEAINTIMYVFDYIETFLQKKMVGINNVLSSFATFLHKKIDLMTLKTEAANNRKDQMAAHAMEESAVSSMPPEYDYCRQLNGARGATNAVAVKRALKAAFSRSGPKPDTIASLAEDIRARTELGLVPCSGGQEASVHVAYKCEKNKWGGRFERADMTSEALFAYDQFPWPPGFFLPASGGYKALPEARLITSEKYMPFVAALSYCQRLRGRFANPAMNLGDPNKPTMAGLSVDAYEDAQAAASTVYNTCIDLLMERAMFSDKVGEAVRSKSSKAADRYDDLAEAQLKQCESDVKTGILDGAAEGGGEYPVYTFEDETQGTCKNEGRSELQAFKDYASRAGAANFMGKYIKTIRDADKRQEMISDAKRDVVSLYRERILSERQALADAIAQAAATGRPSPSSSLGTLTK